MADVTSGSDTREARVVGGDLQIADLAQEIERLRSEPEASQRDRNSVLLYKDEELRVLLTVLRQGAQLDEQRADGRFSLHVLEGAVQVDTQGGGAPLVQGQIAAAELTGPWTVTARQDSVLLLTLAWKVEPADSR